MTGRLILVPTPIGNLEDITERAKKVLASADCIAAEDVNHSRRLLSHLGIASPLLSYHEQGNYDRRLSQVLAQLEEGKTVALISSAGTPGISDPGFSLVRAALQAAHEVECLPGPTAFVPALIISGLPCHRFVFEGFLPRNGQLKRLTEIASETRTTVMYEAPLRVQKLLVKLREMCGGERRVCLVRELSKLHEEAIRGTLDSVIAAVEGKNIKGECVVVLAGKDS